MLHSSSSTENSYFMGLLKKNFLTTPEEWQSNVFLTINSNKKIIIQNYTF